MIPITFLRSSSFNSHDMCQMKYFIEYVLGFSGKSNKKADKGTIFHKTMEVLACVKLHRQNKPGARVFNDDICGKVKIPPNIEDVDVYLILDKVYAYYTGHIVHHEWEEVDYKDCKKWIAKALEFRNGMFNPLKQNIIQPEQNFNIELTQDWSAYEYPEYNLKGFLKLMGTIDLVTQVDKDTYEICDYKTGKNINWGTDMVYTYENIHHNFQLRFYHLVCSILYPQIKTLLITIYFVNDGGPITLTLGHEDISDTLDMIRAKFEEIRDTDFPELNKTWKCTKFCDCGTTTFENTNVSPLVALKKHNFTKEGDILKKCDQTGYALQHRGMSKVITNMTKTGHDMNYYKKPGEV